jgi:hypothetical protein
LKRGELEVESREIILRYRARFDTGTLRAEFVDADHWTNTIRWRIRGRTSSGVEASEAVDLITGDGLIGVRDASLHPAS